MKKILIQYLYIFVIAALFLFIFTWASACETNKTEQVLCKEGQVTTEQEPCVENLEENGNINAVVEGIIKLGESKALPR